MIYDKYDFLMFFRERLNNSHLQIKKLWKTKEGKFAILSDADNISKQKNVSTYFIMFISEESYSIEKDPLLPKIEMIIKISSAETLI